MRGSWREYACKAGISLTSGSYYPCRRRLSVRTLKCEVLSRLCMLYVSRGYFGNSFVSMISKFEKPLQGFRSTVIE